MKRMILIGLCLFGLLTLPTHAQDLPDQLMIVAHPDDELIWGGYHLQKGHYFVLCMTNGQNPTRKKEFETLLHRLHTPGIILNYPDKVNGQRSDWEKEKKNMKQDIEAFLHLKHWKRVVTHNPDGEYGHQHHRMVSQMVTELMKNKARLMYFGQYYHRHQVPKDLTKFDQRGLIKKEELAKSYTSQSLVMKHLHHMFPYEHWVYASQWRNRHE